MTRTISVAVALLAVTAAASLLRLTDLEALVDPDKRLVRVDLTTRAMHTDEAVHAIKFRDLLEKGEYTYNPFEYHGPGLNYLTLPIAWADGADTLVEINETHLRLLPAIFGVGLVAVLWLLRRDLGPVALISAAVLTAISPAMVFYSRYYIQEMLLVFFTFAGAVAMWRAYRAPAGPNQLARRVGWLIAAGFCTGMMHVSKETFVIAGFAATVGVIAVWLWHRKRQERTDPPLRAKNLLTAAVVVLLAAIAISALFHSSFFKNPRGVVDSVLTYEHYFNRAPGEGAGGNHEAPWHEYLHRLLWWADDGEAVWTDGAIWTEAAIVLLALFGGFVAVAGKWLGKTSLALARFLAVYTLVLTVVYALIPYKTPWCMLGFLHGMILLAGVGAAAALRAAPCVYSKAMIAVVLVAAAGHLGYQAWRASGPACEEPTNPYVYAHTTADAVTLADQIRRIAHADPDGAVAPVHVICPDGDVWPLPWYLRDMRRHVGYPRAVPAAGEALAPIVVTKPYVRGALEHRMYNEPPPGQRHMYGLLPRMSSGSDGEDYDYNWVPMLRPNVPLLAFVQRDLWDEYVASVNRQPVVQGPAQSQQRKPTPRQRAVRDVKALARQILRLATCGPDGRATPVQVICPGADVAILSKYLGKLSAVSYPQAVPSASEGVAPIVVVLAEPKRLDALRDRLDKVPSPDQQPAYVPIARPPDNTDRQWTPMLSPDVPLRAFVRRDLWKAYAETQAPPPKMDETKTPK